MEMDPFITRTWESDSDIASIFFKIIHNFRNDVSFFATFFALVRAICATAAGCTARCRIAGYFAVSFFSVSVFQCVSVWDPATLLRDSDKVPELMNFHRRSDTPLGSPVCLRLADRMSGVWFTPHDEVDDIFGYDWGARAPRVLVLAPKRTSDDLIFDSGSSR